MKILWLTWKDRKNPSAGGAEVVNEALAKRLAAAGHQVILLVAGFKNGAPEPARTTDDVQSGGEIIDGYKIIRLGNKWTVYWQAYKYYKRNLKGWADLVIDEMNTIPFFAKFYVKEKNIILCYQLCRQIWFYQMFFPLNLMGYLIEPFYLWLLRKQIVLTESESTKKDLQNYGYKKDNIHVFNIGSEIGSVPDLMALAKYSEPTILILGALRSMKRTLHAVKAFEIAKAELPNLRLIVAGAAEGKYGKKVLKVIKKSKYRDSIDYLGKVANEKKIEIMQKAHLIAVTSVKEGWGLIVTEASSQGTPAVAYNVDGLRDAVKNEETGLVTEKNTPNGLAEKIVELMRDKEKYAKLREAGWHWSKEINFDNSYGQFISKINS
jgi:glycosyltransferase involved in cell wall biosynthesis